MEKKNFGNLGIQVSSIGLGAGRLGNAFERDSLVGVQKLLDEIIDLGVNFIDTAGCYGESEELIGKCLGKRRSSCVISSKTGHDVKGESDWTKGAVIKGVERSLVRLKTDYIDIMHLHSCNLQVLQQGEVIDALEECKRAGKVRFIAFSGENEELQYALGIDRFDSIQASNNFLDQYSRINLFQKAKEKGLGVIGKRPLANFVWKHELEPESYDLKTYWNRFKKVEEATKREFHINDLVYGYIKQSEGLVDTHIVGTSSLENFMYNLEMVRDITINRELLLTTEQLAKTDHWVGVI